jgi:hypothetical protein
MVKIRLLKKPPQPGGEGRLMGVWVIDMKPNAFTFRIADELEQGR